jgi:hypothetical protein
MAAQRVVSSLALAIGTLAALHGPAYAQNPGTMEQQMACTPDVWRLCGAQVPDVDRIVACLRQNTALLSPPCRAVFETSANPPPPPPQQTARTRGRINPPRPQPQYDDAYQPRPQYDGPPPQRRPRYDDDDE